jgi:hypothetical protein
MHRNRELYNISIFAKYFYKINLCKENLSPSFLENASISLGYYLPVFSAHGRDQGKIEG